MSTITFTAKPLTKPEGMTIKAELAWAYFDFNNGGWLAAKMGDDSIVITDESADFFNGQTFPDEDAFAEWLEQDAAMQLDDHPYEFLSDSGAILPALLTEAVQREILNAINQIDDTRKENTPDA